MKQKDWTLPAADVEGKALLSALHRLGPAGACTWVGELSYTSVPYVLFHRHRSTRTGGAFLPTTDHSLALNTQQLAQDLLTMGPPLEPIHHYYDE